MFWFFRHIGFANIVGLALVAFAGCNRSAPSKPASNGEAGHVHEHEGMPATFAEAVAELKEHAPEIKDAFEAGKPAEVHEALHYIGEMSEVMAALIDSSDLTDEQKSEATQASESLFDQYMRLDTEVLHEGSTELKYDEVGGKIDDALAKLEALAPGGDEHDHETKETP